MNQNQQEDPPYHRSDNIPTEIACQEFASLLGSCLPYQHQHRGCECRFKTLIAIHIHNGNTIEEHIKQSPDKNTDLAGNQCQQDTDDIDIQKQFRH